LPLRGDHRPVVEQDELLRERRGVRDAQRGGLVEETLPREAARDRGDLVDRGVRSRLPGRRDERAAAPGGAVDQLVERVEDREHPRPGLRVPGEVTLDAGDAQRVAALQVGADQAVLAPEGAVEAGLRDTGVLDHPVDADGVDALGVEELVSRLEEALLGAPRTLGGGRRGSDGAHIA
jgi:hypothetical protein